ncbi:tyrosine-type recombinase/integrase [Brevibacillus panacihumi]|uniref:tyrosine-type recombinase/integrase n=1 Tax=Brevibacillus panacihumi TaxID=497735 RepID=UPI003CFC79D4
MDKRKGRTLVRKRTEAVYTEQESLETLFKMFLDYKVSQGLRERTIQDHKKHHRYFAKWLSDQYPALKPSELTPQIVQAYISFMKVDKVQFQGHPFSPSKNQEEPKVGLSPSTINIRLRSLKCFLKYLYDHGHVQKNPLAGIKLLRVDEDEIGAFSEQQVAKLLKVVDKKTYAGYRDLALMTLLLDTGLRISEALSLTIEMFDPTARLLTLPGRVTKTRKLRQLPLSPETTKLLKQLVQENKHLFYPDTPEHIFLTAFGDPLKPTIFSRRLRQYGNKAGISSSRVSPHTFRHTFAKFYILNGGDPFTLQVILGHSSMDMVRKYVQMYSEDVKIQHSKFSPLKRLPR